MSGRTLSIAAGALLVITAAVWGFTCLSGRGEAGGSDRGGTVSRLKSGGDEPDVKAPRVEPEAPANGQSTAPAQKSRSIGKRTAPPPGAAVFPDGTWLAPLNGVVAVGPCPWPKTRPYSPVVRIETGDKGLQWYVHADGSGSNTQPVTRTEGGRTWVESGWVVGNPTDPLPVRISSGGGSSSPRK